MIQNFLKKSKLFKLNYETLTLKKNKTNYNFFFIKIISFLHSNILSSIQFIQKSYKQEENIQHISFSKSCCKLRYFLC